MARSRLPSRRCRFLATGPGRIMKWTWPSSSTPTIRTTACPERFPARSRAPGTTPLGSGSIGEGRPAEAVVVLGVQVGDEIDFVIHSLGSGRFGPPSCYGLIRWSELDAIPGREGLWFDAGAANAVNPVAPELATIVPDEEEEVAVAGRRRE